ncbi:AraC family transcriptional regulator [Marinomonas rhizomae]|uniref:AraC-like DNA-binding protein n=1 Tax=Marinomonas rhizomae TaxID=491948 RepID=A0A366JA60_9GAMM|nr:helix-turn-helix domain-containing protein [Marinomonas rhizomae]RBP83174.1 AraC-like DNA-binding protein [Marinomonas rhizomae]RNF72527.1 AraC family transcriptional regulator [Marinomonas rhizomae]
MKDTIQLTSSAPSDDLALFIESFWMIENPSDKDEELSTFPDGGIDLYFFHSAQYPLHVSLVGLETGASMGSMPSHSRLLGVRLKILAAEYLLDMTVADIINDRITLNNGFAGINQDDLFSFDTFCEKLSCYFNSQLTASIDPRKKIMSELIYRTKGAITVTEIAKSANWSSRQINRYFNKWLGLALKSYCDILRFRNSFDTLKMGELFPEEGFNDQSHYIKLIKKYSHLTPKQLAQDENDRFVQLYSED